MVMYRLRAIPAFLITLVLLTSVSLWPAHAASLKERALAQAVKEEVDALSKDVQIMIKAKQFDAAISILQERGSKWLHQYGVKSWPLAEVSSMLAETFLECGAACDKEDSAAELYEKSASVKLEIHGDKSPEYAAAIEKAADAFVKIGSPRRALPHLRKLVKAVSTGLGESHDATRNVLKKFADCAMRAKSYKNAKHAFSKLLRTRLAPDDEADARLQLAVALTALSKNRAALEQIEAAKSFVERYFGKQSMQYAKVLNGAAGVLERLNHNSAAMKSMLEASNIVAGLLGSEDPMAVQAKKNVQGLGIAIDTKTNKHQDMVELF